MYCMYPHVFCQIAEVEAELDKWRLYLASVQTERDQQVESTK